MKTLIAGFSLFMFACSGTADPTEHSSAALHASDPVADLNGTWRFDLEASDVAAAIRTQCANKPGCWDEIAAEAKLEKVRFAPGSGGHSQWTSFAADPKGDELFLSVPVDLSNDGPGHVLAKVAGPATGRQADLFNQHTTQLRVEIVDTNTIAMTDPRKGRLVYTKE
jgi:hypothetical protein